MKFVTKVLDHLVCWVAASWPFAKCYHVVFVDEIPDLLEKRTLYALGAPEPWSVAMRCPCGCGALIHLSLLKTDSPRWTLQMGPKARPSIHPSFWRTTGCRSHFILSNGRVLWCQSR
jgi:hypothetical protein